MGNARRDCQGAISSGNIPPGSNVQRDREIDLSITKRASSLSKQDFLEFTKMVCENVGLALDESKEYLLDSRLSPVAKAGGFPNYASLVQHLNCQPVRELHWQAFEALLTNETMFFRDEHFFNGLIEIAIPSLIEKKKSQKKLHIWCTSVSTGQEAYSLAILIKEYFPELATWDVKIDASDICKGAIQKAKAGAFNAVEIHRGLTPDLIKKYFQLDESGAYIAEPGLKKMIHFFNVNLIGNLNEIQTVDLILIRNVLIYFLPETKKAVLQKMHSKLLDEDSFLMLGAAESLIGDTTFIPHRVGKFSFFKKKSS